MGQQQLLLIILGVIIVGIAIAVGLSLFAANSIQANKDAMINDINNIAANAYQYRIRTTSMGGGNNSYVGYAVPLKLSANANATYVAVNTATTCTITGTSIPNTPNVVIGVCAIDGSLALTPGTW
jgi:flagellar basal body-associated protein FliL